MLSISAKLLLRPRNSRSTCAESLHYSSGKPRQGIVAYNKQFILTSASRGATCGYLPAHASERAHRPGPLVFRCNHHVGAARFRRIAYHTKRYTLATRSRPARCRAPIQPLPWCCCGKAASPRLQTTVVLADTLLPGEHRHLSLPGSGSLTASTISSACWASKKTSFVWYGRGCWCC
jgi:hypothetical protein